MSIDESVTRDLIKTLDDGTEGFSTAADKLSSSGFEDLAGRFREFSDQRKGLASELQSLARQYGDVITENGTVAGTLHRGWLAVKDELAGSSAEGVLEAAEQGEDHAVSEYKKALEADLSPTLRGVVEAQYATVKSAHEEVRTLRDAHQA